MIQQHIKVINNIALHRKEVFQFLFFSFYDIVILVKRMFKKTIKLILIIICMATIFCFSSDNATESTKKSDAVIVKISETVLGRKLSTIEKEKYISKFVVLVRKSAHFTIYFILGLLIISFLREFIPVTYKTVLYATILVFLYACSDEFHQLFSTGRSAELRDVLLDTSGGYIACNIYYLINRLRRKIHE
jgi:VanZ family protein